LATYVGGIPELVIHGENGWLFPAGAISELAAAMKVCLSAPTELLRRMGDRARERVLQRHDVAVQAARLSTLFQGMALASEPASEFLPKQGASRAHAQRWT
jgi:colanic acid/amylovoran biosynthesis glycosyltransferase